MGFATESKLSLALLLTLVLAASALGWSRNILVYHDPSRSSTQWQQHLLRVDPTGGFNPATSHWLFDSAILTLSSVNGKDPFYGVGFTGDDCMTMLRAFVSDVVVLNAAIGAAAKVVPRPTPFQVFVGVPYFNVYNSGFTIPNNGPTYNLWYAEQRSTAVHWYVDQVRAAFANATTAYPNLQFTGVYYHHEDVTDPDVGFVQDYNAYVHSTPSGGSLLQSVFIPYYDAPNVWYSRGLGFDAVIVQPRYAFLSAIDGSIVRGDRLYSTGTKAVAHGPGGGFGMEYELRSSGASQVDYWMAHQYLAISQATGANNSNGGVPQAFFVGGYPDLFDSTVSQAQASTGAGGSYSYTWQAYTDLADYLKGLPIWNYEVWIPPPTQAVPGGDPNVRQIVWTNSYAGIASIRLDFNDPDPANIWRGRLAVLVNGDPAHSSYAARVGVEQPGVTPSYQSVFVPLANENIPAGTPLTIQLVKESSSPWPNVLLLAGAPYEPKYIASPIAGQTSTSSNAAQTDGTYVDSAATHLGYTSGGKLTDGRVSSIGTFNAALAFNWIERRWTVTIDLGSAQTVSSVVIQASRDQGVGVNWPNSTVAYVSAGSTCEPAERGTLAVTAASGSCPPDFATGAPSLLVTYFDGGSRYDGNITLTFAAGAAGRYVAVSGVSYGLSMLHEISVYGGAGALLSLSKPYRVTPMPGGSYVTTGGWGDDSLLLTDGAVFGDWIYGKDHTVGINGTTGGSVQTTFVTPRSGFGYAVIWVSRHNAGFAIEQPGVITMSWRDAATGTWQPSAGTSVPVAECAGGLSPCAKLPLPAGAQVTGVKGVFAPGVSSWWYMVSEVSLMN